MKKNLLICLVMMMLIFGLATNGYSQIGDWIKMAKDAADKKKNKKKEGAEKAKAGQQQKTESAQAGDENNSSQETKEAKARRELLQVKPSDVGKIYFSNKPFTTNHDGAKTSFTTGEYIYGRLETDGRTLREVLKYSPITKENFEHRLIYNLYLYYIDPNSAEGYRWAEGGDSDNFSVLTEADLDKTYWNFDVLPEPAKSTTRLFDRERIWLDSDYMRYERDYSGPLSLYKYLKEKAEEQTYIVKIEFRKKTTDFRGNYEPAEKWLTVEGRATIDFRGTDYPKIKADQEQLEAIRKRRSEKDKEDALNSLLQSESLPQEWTLKSNPLLPGLTDSLIRELFQKYSSYRLEKQIIKIYAAPFTSTQRTVVSNELGIPKYRSLSQWFTVFAKVNYEGENKCFYERFYPVQVYAGAGTYGNYSAIMEDRVDVSCAKLGVK